MQALEAKNTEIKIVCSRPVQTHCQYGVWHNLIYTTNIKFSTDEDSLESHSLKAFYSFPFLVVFFLKVQPCFAVNRSLKTTAGTSLFWMSTRNQHVVINGISLQHLDCGILDSICSLLVGKWVWVRARVLRLVTSSYVCPF